MRERVADAVIVGGGFMGAATAFFLRRRGLSVVLVERGFIGAQASGVNFGNVRRQGRFLPQLPLANRSREIWGRLRELIGEDAEFLASGHIRVVYDREEIGRVEAHAQAARDYGLELELLTSNVLRRDYPYLAPEALMGSYSPLDGHANPRLAAPAFGRAAARLGATVLEQTEVLGIEKGAEDFTVETTAGRLRAPVVQVSAGAWAGTLAERFGEPVPIAAHGPQMAVTEPLPYRIKPVLGVATSDNLQTVYARQVERGNVVFGGGNRGAAYPDLRRAYAVPDNLVDQFRQMRRMLPALKNVRVIRTWSGVEGYMPDMIPVMGPSGRVPGLFYAFGFCGHGFQLGPGVGDVMAELIATGATTTPIGPFSINRFQGESHGT